MFEKAWVRGVISVLFFLIAFGVHSSLKTYDLKIDELEIDNYKNDSIKADIVSAKNMLVEQGAIEEPNDERELINSIQMIIANSHTPFLNVNKFLAAAVLYAMPIAIAASFFGIAGGLIFSALAILCLALFNSDPTHAFDLYPKLLNTYLVQAFTYLFLTGLFAGFLSWITNKTLNSKLELTQIDYTKLKDRHAMVTNSQEQLQKQVAQ
jgi:hypothetical protein